MNQPTPTDPLSELRAIHTPEPVENWPPAFGWWVLLAIILATIGYTASKLIKHYKSRRHLRLAITELEDCYQHTISLHKNEEDNESARNYLNTLNSLLKRVALIDYPQHNAASLVGKSWLEFLNQTSDTNKFTHGAGKVLAQGAYERTIDFNIKDLHELGLYWIERHQRHD